MTDQIVRLGPEYFPRATSGVPISGGSIFVGLPDTDPEIVGNQIQVSALQENGTTVPISQPILTSGGGVPLYNGAPVTLLVSESYSLKVLDAFGVEIYNVTSTNVPVDTTDPTVESIKDIIGLINISSPIDDQARTVLSYFDGLNVGGDDFHWDSSTDKATANGGTIVDPDTIGGFDGTVSTLSAFLSAQSTGIGFGCWLRLNDDDTNVLWFGADRTGVTSSVDSFAAAFDVSNTIVASKGIYDIAGLTATGDSLSDPKLIKGNGPGVTNLTGDGDLITSDGYLWLDSLTIENDTTLGKLLDFGTGVNLNSSIFKNIHFGKSNYHIYADRLVVAWYWEACRFKEADIVSRYFKSIWASTEVDSYVWFNTVGFEAHGGTTFNSVGSCVYEQHTDEAIKLICSDSTTEIVNWNFHGTHFEENGDATTNHVLIETNTDASARISALGLIGITFINAVAKSVPNVGLVKTTGSISRIRFDDYYASQGDLVTDLIGGFIEIGMGRLDTGTIGINQQERTQQIVNGVLAGNDTVQFSNTIDAFVTHLVTISTLATGSGTDGTFQQFAISKLADGTVDSVVVYERTTSYNCVVNLSPITGDYSIDNSPSLPSTFQPRIVVQRI